MIDDEGDDGDGDDDDSVSLVDHREEQILDAEIFCCDGEDLGIGSSPKTLRR
jgi:hypothetical protein